MKGFLTDIIDDTLADLAEAGCVEVRASCPGCLSSPQPTRDAPTASPFCRACLRALLQLGSCESGEEEDPNPSAVTASTLGYIASYYYLKYDLTHISRGNRPVLPNASR